jgi:hypothetical protein
VLVARLERTKHPKTLPWDDLLPHEPDPESTSTLVKALVGFLHLGDEAAASSTSALTISSVEIPLWEALNPEVEVFPGAQ